MSTDYDKNSTSNVSLPRFVSRVYAYPIVNDACGQVASVYNKVRDCNRMIHAGFDLAESGLKLVTTTAAPIINKLDNQITYIDDLSCKQLDKLEEKVPIVTKSTREISKEAKVLLNETIAPKVETVENVYASVKKKVVSVQEFGKAQLHNAANTSCAKFALSKMDYALDVTDKYIDYYLPEEKGDTEQQPYKTSNINKGSKEGDTLAKAGYLTAKMRKRMFAKAMSQLQQVKVRSFEAIEKMSFTVDLISYAKTQIQTVADKATNLENDFKYKLWELESSKENKAQQKQMKSNYDRTCYDEPSTNSNKAKERQLLNSLFYWSQKLSLSLQAGKAVLVERIPIPERVRKSYLMAAETAQTLYHNVLNLKTNNFVDSVPLIRKGFTTIDQYLKSFFDYLDEAYNRYKGLVSHDYNEKNKTFKKKHRDNSSNHKNEQETNEIDHHTFNSLTTAENNRLDDFDNTQEENTVTDDNNDDDYDDDDDDDEDSEGNEEPSEEEKDDDAVSNNDDA